MKTQRPLFNCRVYITGLGAHIVRPVYAVHYRKYLSTHIPSIGPPSKSALLETQFDVGMKLAEYQKLCPDLKIAPEYPPQTPIHFNIRGIYPLPPFPELIPTHCVFFNDEIFTPGNEHKCVYEILFSEFPFPEE